MESLSSQQGHSSQQFAGKIFGHEVQLFFKNDFEAVPLADLWAKYVMCTFI